MKYRKHEIRTQCAEIAECLTEALEAIRDPAVLDEVAHHVLNYPEIAWEPVSLAALALNIKRRIADDKARASGAPPLPSPQPLPAPPLNPPDDEGGNVSLPPPPAWAL
jgi:hypothetical protein